MFFLITTALSSSCTQKFAKPDFNEAPGQVSVIQVATSENETHFNIVKPRLRTFTYTVYQNGKPLKGAVQLIKNIQPPLLHWGVDKLKVVGLKPNTDYELFIEVPRYKWLADRRTFKTLDLKQKNIRFAFASCMSDAYSHKHARDLIWDQLARQNPDLIILGGDNIYVDSYDFVARDKVTEHDIWRRYFDSIRSLPIFSQKKLIPILATWDDHDYGVNNANKNFHGKDYALKAFKAVFGSANISGIYENGSGVYKSFKGFGQNFYLLDNRSFREETHSTKAYAHLGKTQHEWLMKNLKADNDPSWIINGGQFFADPFIVERNGKKRQLNESFLADHPTHFNQFINDLKEIKTPFAFISGDIHFSEILKIENVFDFTTYELTSSPIHAFMFRPEKGQPEFWPNPRRVVAHRDYNYFLVDSKATKEGLDIEVSSYGVKQKGPFFKKTLSIKR